MSERLQKHTKTSLLAMKEAGRPITMLTAYDAGQAAMVEEAGMDVILVGDSLGNVVLGYETTIPVTIDDMVYHAKAVRRGAPNTMMLVDMPFLTYHQAVADTLRTAGRLMQEAQADGVKLEGGKAILPHIRALTEAGIPVCGHIGLTPQSVLQLGGFRVQGKDVDAAERMLEDARGIAEAGAFMVVLECIPNALAELITNQTAIPTIGIGAGTRCSGQVLVFHDLLGMSGTKPPKFVKPYLSLRAAMVDAMREYRDEVRQGQFPDAEHSYDVAGEVMNALYGDNHRMESKPDDRNKQHS